jgi:hydrogenase expression/formation protein HypE
MTPNDRILIAHGGGGQLTAELIAGVILPALGSPQAGGALTDAACLPPTPNGLAFTTDSYVVQPLEFPGGDIGKLAVCGTVNDLAVCGAEPMALSLALVLEEGLQIAILRRVLQSAGAAARQAGVAVVTGDTKVVQRGKGDGVYINTSGVGRRLPQARLGLERLEAGDVVIASGTLGDHGLTVMSCREGLTFGTELVSDCAPLNGPCLALVRELGPALRFMRDMTRGGLAAVAAEVAAGSGHDIELREAAIPVRPAARSAAEMLGLDVLTVANEGKFLAVVAADAADAALRVLRKSPLGRDAAAIGTVGPGSKSPLVELLTEIGGRRVVQMPYGEELPRIC